MIVVRHFFRYGTRGLTVHDTIESAVSSAEWDAEEGESSLDRIDVWENGVCSQLTNDAYKAAVEALTRAASETAAAIRQKTVAELVVHGTVVDWFYDMDDANEELARFRADLPPDAVWLNMSETA